ncbi:hypothetical protein CROQUDRAFT_99896 [Cronartium quercuum f. sp. fusiforme G11]|uniref:Calcineurin-like phosphoesterase domain-containing protein n=1 Tax=Cronartium quercuum f. sp. fusiforme G11 TaxID=708437 RepID=A0A9P6N799_9BASI|nr:hypothetical protein CROQUDRAFT_99896 [Cronartium quercuum f. sp. fusiforme G11]
MPFRRSEPTARQTSFDEDLENEEDAELLLPAQDGTRYKRIQKVKYSVSYILLASAAAFVLAVMVWLGPSLPNRDPPGLGAQSHATVGQATHDIGPAADHRPVSDDRLPAAVIPASNSSKAKTHRPPIAVNKPLPEQQPLPAHRWNPLLFDPSPLTHIYVKPCMFPPWAFPSFCEPPQSAKDKALYGKWVRVPRDISKGVGHYYTELYYRRMQTSYVSGHVQGVQPITGLRVIEQSEAETPEMKAEIERDGWEPAGENLRTGIWPAKIPAAKLWFTRSTTFNSTSHPRPIIEVDVLWGKPEEVTPWWGFERIGSPVFKGDNEVNHIRCDIVVRRENIKPGATPNLYFNTDGKFKILQIADLHFSASGGECMNAELLPSCEKEGADATTAKWISKVIDKQKPDLIVLSGDQLSGNGKTFDTLSTLIKVGHLIGDKQIPWTVIFGDHDTDKALAKEEQMYVLKWMPYFVGKAGPGVPGVSDEGWPSVRQVSDMGVGNYVLGVNGTRTDNTQALTLYFLDSHDTIPMTVAQLWSMAMGAATEYDWLKESQIEWYRNQSSQQPSLLRPYWPSEVPKRPSTPAPTKLIRRQQQPRKLRKPPAIMFFHIPVPEAYAKADKNPKTGGELLFGNQKQGPVCPSQGLGFFERAVLNTTDGAGETEVKVIANGHAHMTDTCRRHDGVWHCFAGGASYSAVGEATWERRVRVFEVEEFGEIIRTHSILDERVLVGEAKSQSEIGKLDLYGPGSVPGTGIGQQNNKTGV